MLNHIGTNIIETKRLLLRKFKIEDALQMFDNWAKDPENVKYLSWQAHENISETNRVISDWIEEYKNNNSYRWCITLKDTGEVIGCIDVIETIELRATCEIGYVLSKKYWNKGFMTECLKAVIGYLFDKVNFNRIQLKHDLDNPASGKVMIKNGLKREGVLRECYRNNKGKLRDMAIYSILKSEFKEDF